MKETLRELVALTSRKNLKGKFAFLCSVSGYWGIFSLTLVPAICLRWLSGHETFTKNLVVAVSGIVLAHVATVGIINRGIPRKVWHFNILSVYFYYLPVGVYFFLQYPGKGVKKIINIYQSI